MIGLISKNKPYFDRRDLFAILKFWQKGNVEKFEKRFSEFVNAKYALSFPYARSAIWALLKIWEIERQPTSLRGVPSLSRDDEAIPIEEYKPEIVSLPMVARNDRSEVIISAYTCTVVAHAVIKAGLRPCFVDIELDTYNPKIDEILSAVSEKTRAIIPVHTFGNIMDLDGLINKLPRKDVLIIEDSALCPKPIYKNPAYPNIVSIYSLGHTKHFSTVEGGMAVTDNEEIYRKLLEFRSKNFIRPPLLVNLKNLLHFFIRYFLFGKTGYYFLDLLSARGGSAFGGKNFKMLEKYYDERSMNEVSLPKDFNVLFSEWQARLGFSQLSKAVEILEKRKKIAEFYYNELKNFNPDVIPQRSPDLQSGDRDSLWSHYPVRIIGRDAKMIREKMKKKGIEVGITFDYSLPELPIFREYKDREFPNSQKAAEEMINLPNYPSLSNFDAKFIVQSLKNTFN